MPTLNSPQSKSTGALGEDLAANYLTQRNFQIITRNWKCFLGEIDIVAIDKKTKDLVFVEVKARFQDPLLGWESLHAKKQKKLKRLALAYLKFKNLPLETKFRFDVVLVNLSSHEIIHEPGALRFENELD